MNRNMEILRTMEAERLPILPFELEFAKRAFQAQIMRQSELGRRLGEAMSQTSETWHDNAAADAVTSDSAALTESANYIGRIIHESDVFPYEVETDEGVTLGSLVGVRFGASQDVSYLYITGSTRELSDEIKSELPKVEDIAVATIFSPIGRALLGVKAGEVAQFEAPNNGRTIEIHVDTLQQVILPTHSAEPTA